MAENVPACFEVLFVAMNKERYQGLSDEHRAIIDELAGLPMSQMMAKSFDSADEIFLNMNADIDMKYEWKVVTDEERAKMDAAVRMGMEEVYAEYACSRHRQCQGDLRGHERVRSIDERRLPWEEAVGRLFARG